MNQSELEANTCSRGRAREKAREQVDREFCQSRSVAKQKPKQLRKSFATCLILSLFHKLLLPVLPVLESKVSLARCLKVSINYFCKSSLVSSKTREQGNTEVTAYHDSVADKDAFFSAPSV